ncbi:MAG: hypothetical protein HC837_14790 [Chloroflexaceae bacterium]|nr:hypothetical protein [Chloroflexaceae bacterium]
MVTRIASTMGNAIFVAAYLIMIVPLGLYRMLERGYRAWLPLSETNQPAPNNIPIDLIRGIAHVLLAIGTLLLLLGIVTFGASVQTIDFRYWWMFPGAVAVCTGLWALPTMPLRPDRKITFWPGFVFLAFVLLLSTMFNVSNNPQEQVVNDRLPWACPGGPRC